MKKFGRPAKKVIESSPLSLPRVDHMNETQNSQVPSNKPTEQKVQATVEKGSDQNEELKRDGLVLFYRTSKKDATTGS